FLAPYYRELVQTLRARQTARLYFEIDTDGNPDVLLPEYLACGMDAMEPFEVAADCDVVAVGERYPRLVIGGGIDKRVLAAGPEAIDRELDRIVPAMVARGGYVPTCDHGVPNDVSYASYCHYRQRMMELDH
ncbi:MAG: uroporphyrinogen decarboxylase family protein, partial [Planctomycetota bacterium]